MHEFGEILAKTLAKVFQLGNWMGLRLDTAFPLVSLSDEV